jgi:hypothetical protein
MSRHHVREVYSTSEAPTLKDEEELQAKKTLLDQADVDFYEDRSEKLWYKLNDNKNGDKEIMIIESGNEKNANPLSNLSSIVKNIGDVKQIRIYVWPQSRAKAEEVLR